MGRDEWAGDNGARGRRSGGGGDARCAGGSQRQGEGGASLRLGFKVRGVRQTYGVRGASGAVLIHLGCRGAGATYEGAAQARLQRGAAARRN